MRRPLAISAVALLLAVGAAAPTTIPTMAPSTQPTPPPPIARWFAELTDPSPAVRDAAAEQMMGLPVTALPQVLELARAAGPSPARDAVLREVVTHVFLAGESYDVADPADPFDPTDGPRYIMGQNWPRGMRGVGNGLGAPVIERWLGFPARRYFRDGDLVIGLYNDLAAPVDRPVDVPTPTRNELVDAMRRAPRPAARRVLRIARWSGDPHQRHDGSRARADRRPSCHRLRVPRRAAASGR